MGEGLQWFFSTIADLPGGRSAMGGGGKVCNITQGMGRNPAGIIYFHFVCFAPVPFLTRMTIHL